MADLEDRCVLLVIPPARFKDQEFDTLKAFLERRKCKIQVASSQMRESYGMEGRRVRPDVTLEAADVAAYAAVVFVGGMGTRDYWDLPTAHDLARRALEANCIVGATSTAPVILARAGLLEGRQATVYFSESKQIIDRGAQYTAGALALDGRILTCKGPEAVERFAMALIKMLLDDKAAG